MAKVVLVVPPIKSDFGIGVPIGVLTIATVLRRAGIDVSIFDFSLDVFKNRISLSPAGIERCAEVILQASPEIIGFNIQCATLPIVLAIIKRLHGQTDAKIVIGGPQSIGFIQALNDKSRLFIDQVFIGASEIKFVGYCQEHLYGSISDASASNIKQIFPDYSIIDAQLLKQYPQIGYIDNARGCDNCCSFCSESHFWGTSFQYKSISSTIEHIRQLYSIYGIRQFEFTHDNFLMSPQYAFELMEALSVSGMKISWHCRTPLSTLTPETVNCLKKSGCVSILSGVETFPANRIAIGKIVDSHNIKSTVKSISDAGIRLVVSFVVGFPGETKKETETTANFAAELMSDMVTPHIHKFAPLPYAETGNITLNYEPKDISDMVFSRIDTPEMQDEIDLIVTQNPELCKGFYSVPSTAGFPLGDFAARFNIMARDFRISFRFFQSHFTNNIVDDIEEFFKLLCTDIPAHPIFEYQWFRWFLVFEKQKNKCAKGLAVRIQLPGNFSDALKQPQASTLLVPAPLEDWVLLHRSNGSKQLLKGKKNTIDRYYADILKYLKDEEDFAWQHTYDN